MVGGILQIHVYTIMDLLFEAEEQLRSSATILLGIMLRQGLLNPLQVR